MQTQTSGWCSRERPATGDSLSTSWSSHQEDAPVRRTYALVLRSTVHICLSSSSSLVRGAFKKIVEPREAIVEMRKEDEQEEEGLLVRRKDFIGGVTNKVKHTTGEAAQERSDTPLLTYIESGRRASNIGGKKEPSNSPPLGGRTAPLSPEDVSLYVTFVPFYASTATASEQGQQSNTIEHVGVKEVLLLEADEDLDTNSRRRRRRNEAGRSDALRMSFKLQYLALTCLLAHLLH